MLANRLSLLEANRHRNVVTLATAPCRYISPYLLKVVSQRMIAADDPLVDPMKSRVAPARQPEAFA
jgi:hypothetical protein